MRLAWEPGIVTMDEPALSVIQSQLEQPKLVAKLEPNRPYRLLDPGRLHLVYAVFWSTDLAWI